MNNRKFEFRVWDVNGKNWIDLSKDYNLFYQSSLPDFLLYGKGGQAYNQIIQQWTGFKDKKGNKIFEGDIVVALRDTGAKIRKGQIYYIYYNRKMAHYGMVIPSHYNWIHDNSYNLYEKGYDTAQMSKPKSTALEVIGNIIESPHLLK